MNKSPFSDPSAAASPGCNLEGERMLQGKWLLAGTTNKDINKVGKPPLQGQNAQFVECQPFNSEIAGSSPALVGFSLFNPNLKVYNKGINVW